MFKLKFSVCLALLVGALTLIISLAHEVSPLAALYRSIVSVVVFGCVGFAVVWSIEGYLRTTLIRRLSENETRDNAVQIQEPSSVNEGEDDEGFIPVTPDQFEHIVRSRDNDEEG